MGVKSKYEKGRLKFHSGAVDNEVVSLSSLASSSLANYGVTFINNAVADAVYKFLPPSLGAVKEIIVADTTKIITIIAFEATINGSATFNKITLVPTTKAEKVGASFTFYGASTNMWYMSCSLPYMSTNCGTHMLLAAS
jgi:hypothetical protein